MISFPSYNKTVDSDWELLEAIGKGTYGDVFKGKRKVDDAIVAIKVTDFNQNKNEEMKTELAVLENFSNHENIVKFIDAQFMVTVSGTEQLWIITEYCVFGAVCSLSKRIIREGSYLDESFISLIIFDTLKGLQYLHDNKIIHRDVKGSNILLNANGNIKLIDFGVSTQLKDEIAKCRSSVGTPFWMAPEVIACEQQLDYCYDNRCDVWSLGITAIELADGDPPLADQHPMRALFKIPRNPSPTVQRPDKWTKTFLDFILFCLIKDFEERPFVYQLLEHEFCTKIKRNTHILRSEFLTFLKLKYKKHDSNENLKTRSRVKISERPSERLDMAEIQNLVHLENLQEDTILQHLYERYLKNKIYTNIGDILIAVNPFKPLGIYKEEVAKKYRNIEQQNLPPHVYQVARSAHFAVLHKRKNQCCVISGESGAGKTVTSNYLVEQLAALGKQGSPTLVNKLLQVNPLMEAFGNAATNINENSSRFGKFLELSFSDTGDLIEAQLSEFLLEKSRVIYQSRGERNYHILYYLIAGLDYHRKLGNFDLSSSDKHRYLNTDNETLDQFACTPQMQEKFLTIQKCFDIIGFTQEEVQSLYCILAAVIHIGDIEIVNDDSMTHHGERGCIKNSDTLNTVASLLCVQTDDLADAITSASSVTRGETILRYNTVEQSQDCRDATAKALYSRLFSWIVKRINILLKSNGITSPRNNYRRIGILDIFGFENFSTNSFEQLCINIANEQLQFYFNQHVFEWEFEEYASEGIPLDTISFQNNRPVLEMFLQRPMGVLALLDEESRFPRATVFSLVEKFCDNMNKNYFQKPKDSTSSFVIQHYAGNVTYDANGFLEKNRDTISSDVMHLLRTSEDRLVRTIFQGNADHSDDLRRKNSNSSSDSFTFKADGTFENKPPSVHMSTSKLHLTMSVHFRNSLRSLMAKMIQADPHFIRCIRPNSKNVPDVFDESKVLDQLRYTGVLETSKIRRQGYSERIQFGEFVNRYKCLVYYLSDDPPRDANTCRNILKTIGIETLWRIGKTKVFLKYFQADKLAFLLEEYRRNAIKVQRFAKAWLYKIKFKKERALMVEAAIVMQKNIRRWLARRRCAYMRGEIAEKRQAKIEKSAVKIQKGHTEEMSGNDEAFHGYLAKKRFKKLTEEREKEMARERHLQMVGKKDEDDTSSEDSEGETSLQDTKLFFFLAQIQMSTSDYNPLLHRTCYPVLFSLRKAATEKARKEASNQKIGSRERVLAVLDGTDDMLQSKYHWAREKFETKVIRARPSHERENERWKIGLETERSLSAISKDVNENDIRSRSSSWKSNENIEYVRKPDKLLSKFEEHQQWRRKVEQDDDDQIEVNNDIRRFGGRKEYPLRSLMEKNNYEHDGLTSDISRFKWVSPHNEATTNELSYLARETSVPTEEKVHRRLDAWKKSSKQFDHSPGMTSFKQPYSYLQSSHVHNNRKDKDKHNDYVQTYVLSQQTDASSGRREKSEENEVLFKEHESQRIKNQSKNYHKAQYGKEKGLREPLNRVLPRTDLEIHKDGRTDGLSHQSTKIDSSNSLANQIENHLSARKLRKSQKTEVLPKPNNIVKRVESNERSLTSIENSNKLKQINGFSYGIQEGQRGMLQGLHLRKTGRLQMLVQN